MTKPTPHLHWSHQTHRIVRERLAAGHLPRDIAAALGISAAGVRAARRAMLAEWSEVAPAVSMSREEAQDIVRNMNLDPPPITWTPPEPPPMLPAAEVRLRDELARARRERDEALRTANRGEDMRKELFKLAPIPPPVTFPRPPHSDPRAETVILFASDWHVGETIALDKMDGLNSYDPKIAERRAGRLFTTTAELMSRHWTGPKPARLILILGGDMISGEIHEELAKSNTLLAIPAVQACASAIMGGLAYLLDALPDVPIEVLSLPGNHGRSTFKPQSKYVDVSYDMLAGNIVEAHFKAKGETRIKFWAPTSGDAVFSLDGWVILATHGDRIGSRGGQGFVGPAATAARGFKRLVADYAARGTIVDLVLCGHFHTPLRLEEGYVCGTLAGPSEYARDGRFRPHPASQLFLTIHPRRGVTQVREISVGAPEEGSIYADRQDNGTLRPRYRVPAISIPR